MDGRLYRVSVSQSNVLLFDSDAQSRNGLFLIGGLTDGLMSLPYTKSLSSALQGIGWSLLQVNLSSSFSGFGMSSIDRDVAELQTIIKFIESQKLKDTIAFMGHSTGAQDVLALMNDLKDRPTSLNISGCILQGALSDREAMQNDPEAEELQKLSLNTIDMNAPLPKLMYGVVPICASRFLSLNGRMTPDDMFSSDLNASFLDFTLRGVRGYPMLIVQGNKDEYVTIDRQKFKDFFCETYKKACLDSGATSVYVKFLDGSHSLGEVSDSLAGLVCSFLKNGGLNEEERTLTRLGRWFRGGDFPD
eukprot:GDKJ01020267.1.p1 GENE.GDKJ01020267.1~~GDKJ01020267.1.p1  ORF type:complete len:304 (-),score=60.17 GDKJ01020267.1:195-1106(-)